jgi:asparagine synthase (glutamine-hydrolysing)
MNDIIAHRGPDFENSISIKNISLGHRRLSIIDLSENGNQPMQYLHYYIIYNGEIYNFQTIRKELINLGYTFTSETDTEVILAAYDYWKEQCLDKFNGMFAFIIYDSKNNTVFIARDRFGIKPLYYWNPNNNQIFFASEIKQFTVFPKWKPTLNKRMAKDFLIHGLIDHTDETMFKNVYQIKGGHCAKFSINEQFDITLSIKKWYTIKTYFTRYDHDEMKNKLKSTFLDTLKIHLISDVPIGSCLSGGLDSSSIVCGISDIKTKNNTLKTFTSCSHIPQYDEKKYVDIIINKKNIKNYCVYPEYHELLNELEKLIWHQDEPPQSSSIYAQMKIFQEAKKQNIKVMLDGQGADEIFAGYIPYFFVYSTELVKHNSPIEAINQLKKAYTVHKFPIRTILQNLFNTVFIKTPLSKYILNFNDWIDISKLGYSDYHPSVPITYNNLTNKLQEHLSSTSLPALLHWEDRNSMTYSIEARVPFLDYRIVEIGYNTPSEYKLKDGITKFILRDSLKDILPEEIVNRKDKMGFVTPEEIWMKENKTATIALLENSINNSNGIIKHGIINKFEKMTLGEEPFTFLFFRVISFGIWIKTFNINID